MALEIDFGEQNIVIQVGGMAQSLGIQPGSGTLLTKFEMVLLPGSWFTIEWPFEVELIPGSEYLYGSNSCSRSYLYAFEGRPLGDMTPVEAAQYQELPFIATFRYSSLTLTLFGL